MQLCHNSILSCVIGKTEIAFKRSFIKAPFQNRKKKSFFEDKWEILFIYLFYPAALADVLWLAM